MEESFSLRLQKLELTVEQHKNALQDRHDNERKLWDELSQIKGSINQVKYAVIGGIGVIIAQNTGFFNAIKVMF